MDVFQAVRTRRSIRSFTSEMVSEEDVMKLIDAARWAPSAGNNQPWEFIIVREPRIKRDLSVAALDQMFLEEAPVLIVVCANQLRSMQRYGSRGTALYCLQDTAAATQNIHLAACALGLASCWVGAFDEEKVKEALCIPSGVRPVAIIPVGRPAEKPKTTSRRSTAEIVHKEVFGKRSTAS